MRIRHAKAGRGMAILLAGVVLLTACKREQQEAPELLEPMTTNDAYRPVVRGNIGDIGSLEVLKGVVVPQEDCYFFNTSATIDDVKVAVGDYVEEGTVLATLRQDELETAIADLTENLKFEKENHGQQGKLYKLTMEKLNYQLKAAKKAGDTSLAAELKKQQAMEEENYEYAELIYKRRIKQLESELGEQRKLLADGKLVAKHAGYVTYVKNLAKDAEARVSENVVIIADYSKRYLEVWDGEDNVRMDETNYLKAESVYTTEGGKKYELTMYEYSKDILALMEAKKEYANIRYEIPEGIDVEVGDFLPVCYAKKNVPDVLIIGKDSLYTEGNDRFVYVKTEKHRKERREITTGDSDEHYIEVTSGLKEGEEVYYSSLALMPANYKPMTVELTDYHQKARTSQCELSDKVEFNLYAQDDWKITEIFIAEGDTIKEGDLVFKVKAEGGKADLIAAKDAIRAEEKSYKKLCEEYKKQLAELDKQIKEAEEAEEPKEPGETEEHEEAKEAKKLKEAEEPKEPGETEEVGETEEQKEPKEPGGTEEPEETEEQEEKEEPEEPLTADMFYQKEQLICDREMAVINQKLAVKQHEFTMKQLKKSYAALKLVNDGNGYQNIYADRGGLVTSIQAQADKRTAAGSVLYTVQQESTKKLLVTMAPMTGEDAKKVQDRQGAELNQKIRFQRGNQVSEGICVARQATSSKVYYTELDGTVYSSTNPDDVSDNWQSNAQFYVAMKDTSYYDHIDAETIEFDSVIFKNAVVLPAAMVYTEQDKISDTTYYYVWKIMNGELVKQYVTISEIVKDAVNIMIVAGVSEGDILAKECAASDMETKN